MNVVMTDTVGGLVRAAMRKAGILAAGEPLPADEGDDGLEVLRDMLDDWDNEELMIPVVTELLLPLLSNQSVYTGGIYPSPQPAPLPENHLETPRPIEIQAAFIRDGYGTDYPQEIIDVETFSRISRKTDGARPSRFFVQQGWPMMTFTFESVPYADEVMHFYVVQPLSAIIPTLGLTEVVDLPPGYRQTIIYNLAILLAPEWSKEVPRSIAAIAASSKKKIKRRNYEPVVLGMDRAVATQRRGIGTYIIEQGP